MDLVQLTEAAYQLRGGSNAGLIVQDGRAVLVDTGLDRDTAKKILRHIESLKITLAAVVITHAHADHCGGAATIRARTGAPVYAPALEADVVANPIWETALPLLRRAAAGRAAAQVHPGRALSCDRGARDWGSGIRRCAVHRDSRARPLAESDDDRGRRGLLRRRRVLRPGSFAQARHSLLCRHRPNAGISGRVGRAGRGLRGLCPRPRPRGPADRGVGCR